MRYYYQLLKWSKVGTLTTQNADKDIEQQELSFTASGNTRWSTTLEGTSEDSYKTKYTLMHRNMI